eukprot:11506175-Ditylum_brightwellii.AAC.1
MLHTRLKSGMSIAMDSLPSAQSRWSLVLFILDGMTGTVLTEVKREDLRMPNMKGQIPCRSQKLTRPTPLLR